MSGAVVGAAMSGTVVGCVSVYKSIVVVRCYAVLGTDVGCAGTDLGCAVLCCYQADAAGRRRPEARAHWHVLCTVRYYPVSSSPPSGTDLPLLYRPTHSLRAVRY
eukprot:63229-Rhodomonas_salina.6